MHSKKSVLTFKEYGKIHIHLQELMKERGMSRNQLARSINTRFEVVDRWYNDKVEKIDADILARICYVLECDIEELIRYERDDGDI